MPDLFLPDSLCRAAVLSLCDVSPEPARPASLAGYAVVLKNVYALPGLAPAAPESRATGQVHSVPEGALDRVAFVLRAGALQLRPVDIAGAQVLVPCAGTGDVLDPERWDARLWPVWQRALPEVIGLYGQVAPDDMGLRMPMILMRTHSRAMAEAHDRPDASGFSSADVQVDRATQPYLAYFGMHEYFLRHPTFSGAESTQLRRAVFMASDAVTVLPYDPCRDRVLLVEQFRMAPFARGDRRPWVLEPIAGRIEPGDTPEETARKEAAEEAGLSLRTLHRVGGYYPSTGCVSEYIFSYVGLTDLPDGAGGLHGVEAEGEDIRAHVLSRAEMMARIAAGEMPDAPLLVTAYWLELNRARLLDS